MDNNIDGSSLAPSKVKVTAKEFGAKFKDKREVYHFLSHKVGVFLCSYDTVTIWHLRDLMSGKRTRIKGENVKHIHVPCYENLTIQEFLKFAQGYPAALQVLPVVENRR